MMQFACVYQVKTDCGKTLFYESFSYIEAIRMANQDGFVVVDISLSSLDSEDIDNFLVYDRQKGE